MPSANGITGVCVPRAVWEGSPVGNRSEFLVETKAGMIFSCDHTDPHCSSVSQLFLCEKSPRRSRPERTHCASTLSLCWQCALMAHSPKMQLIRKSSKPGHPPTNNFLCLLCDGRAAPCRDSLGRHVLLHGVQSIPPLRSLLPSLWTAQLLNLALALMTERGIKMLHFLLGWRWVLN